MQSVLYIKTPTVSRIIPLRYIEYVEFHPPNQIHLKTVSGGQNQKPLTFRGREEAKRVFYDILKEQRANAKVIEVDMDD